MSSDNLPLFTGKQLRALILPLIVEQFLGIFVGMADTMMVPAQVRLRFPAYHSWTRSMYCSLSCLSRLPPAAPLSFLNIWGQRVIRML